MFARLFNVDTIPCVPAVHYNKDSDVRAAMRQGNRWRIYPAVVIVSVYLYREKKAIEKNVALNNTFS